MFYNWVCNWVFQLQRTLATHGIYTTLSVIEQVVVVIADTLCRVQYRNMMQLTCNYMQFFYN